MVGKKIQVHKRDGSFCVLLDFPDDALANTSHSADLTDTGAILPRHTYDVVATLFRVTLNLGKIVSVADGVKIFTHLFIGYPYFGLVTEVEDVERLRKRLIDQGSQIFLRYPSIHVLSRTDR